MNVLKEAIGAVSRRETGAQLPERVLTVLQTLQTSKNIDEDARADIISIMDDSVELAAAMVNHTYPVELILRRVTSILSTSQRILMHTESFRPGRLAFSAMLPDGQLLDFVASTYEEATAQLARLQEFGVPRTAVIVPVRVSSQYVMQPQVRPQFQAIPGGGGMNSIPHSQANAPPDWAPAPPAPPQAPLMSATEVQALRGLNQPASSPERLAREEEIRRDIDALAGKSADEPAGIRSTLHRDQE
jgi:hypothetical protein